MPRLRPGKWLTTGFCCGVTMLAPATASDDPDTRSQQLLQAIRDLASGAATEDAEALPQIEVRQCQTYPYGRTRPAGAGRSQLLEDLASGLETGLSCLAGSGPTGPLHAYHAHQGRRLLELFSARRQKTFHCVADGMFATAVATGPGGTARDDPLHAQLSRVNHPGVVIDTFRMGGMLSRRFDDDTYRDFFQLGDDQIYQHRNGQPLRIPSLHRFGDRAALLFHETVHWLGHEHSAIRPDLAHLYETCCFGGSDYIRDPGRNRQHQLAACQVLKDDDLWRADQTPYRQMRIWHHKGYDALKSDMRDDYAD